MFIETRLWEKLQELYHKVLICHVLYPVNVSGGIFLKHSLEFVAISSFKVANCLKKGTKKVSPQIQVHMRSSRLLRPVKA
jgi:hypothetical protein